MNALVGPHRARPLLARILWPLVRFDLRRFRVLVLLLVALELARAAFVEWALHLAPLDMGRARSAARSAAAETTLLDAVLWLATGRW